MILLAMLLAATTPPATPPSRLDADAAAVARATRTLEPHLDGTWLDGKPGTDRLVAAQWQAMQRWAADWLDLHPHADAAALVAAGKRFGDDWSFSAADLDDGAMLVSVSRWQAGNVFILAADARGGHRLRWSSATPQHRLDRRADLALSQWQPAVQNGACKRCSVMGSPNVGRLPRADGAVRFWIEGSYAQEMGATMAAQLSLWSWHHDQVRPLLVHDYAIMADQHPAVLRGATLHVPSKGEWRSLFACGSCFGRVTDLRFAIGPHRIRALAPVSETPELDLIDRVYARVLARRPVGALATPAALRVIRAQLRNNLGAPDPQVPPSAGMVTGWGRWRSQGRRWACLVSDGSGATAFAFDNRLHRITEARIFVGDACQGKDARM